MTAGSSGIGSIVYLWDADYPWDVRVEKVCASCTQAGYDVHIVARNRAWRPLEERLPVGTVHRMRPWRWAGRRGDGLLSFPAFMSPRWLRHLSDVVRRVRPSVIVVRDLPLCPTAIWIGKRHGVPVVLDMAENYPAMMRKNFEAGRHRLIDYLVRNPAMVSAVERYCLPRLDRIIVVVEENAARLERLGVAPDRISLVSNTPPASLIEGRPARRGGDTGGGRPDHTSVRRHTGGAPWTIRGSPRGASIARFIAGGPSGHHRSRARRIDTQE
jgi:hypothetical protein